MVELQLLNLLPSLIQQVVSGLPIHDIIITECMSCITDLSLQVSTQAMGQPSVFTAERIQSMVIINPIARPKSIFVIKAYMSEIHAERIRKISLAQDREANLSEIKQFIKGIWQPQSTSDTKRISRMACDYELREQGTLVKIQWSTRRSRKARMEWKLVIPRGWFLWSCNCAIQV